MPGALGYVWDPVGEEWVKTLGDAAGNVQIEGTVTVDTSDLATEVTLAKLVGAATPVIYNVTMTNADTEYSQALPASCKKFLIHTRAGEAFRLAFVTGKVATPTAPYFSITPSDAYGEDLVLGAAVTLFFASASAGAVAEIIAWS
jgi:hypothetical protein